MADDVVLVDRQAAEARLVAMAQADPEFRARLIADPKKVISEVDGDPLPDSVTIEVLEETPTHFYIVIPQPLALLGDMELDDEALEAVAGGNISSGGFTPWKPPC